MIDATGIDVGDNDGGTRGGASCTELTKGVSISKLEAEVQWGVALQIFHINVGSLS